MQKTSLLLYAIRIHFVILSLFYVRMEASKWLSECE